MILCHPMDCSQAGSSTHRILQARILEWVDIPFSRGSSWPRSQTRVSCIAGRFFTIWATRGAHTFWVNLIKLMVVMWPKLGQCKSPSKSFRIGMLHTEVVSEILSAPGTLRGKGGHLARWLCAMSECAQKRIAEGSEWSRDTAPHFLILLHDVTYTPHTWCTIYGCHGEH